MEFLKYVVKDLYGRFNGNLGDLTIVLPTRRAGLFIRKYLAEMVKDKPLFVPRCITISDLFDSLCSFKPVDEVKAVCVLYDVYCEQMLDVPNFDRTMSPDAFYGWGKQLIADFNNADKNFPGLSPIELFKLSSEAREFDNPNIDPEVRDRIMSLLRGGEIGGEYNKRYAGEENSQRQAFKYLWRKLPDIYSEFVVRLEKENLALEGMRNRWVIDNFDTICDEIKNTTFAFVGFNMLTYTEQTLMRRIKETSETLFYWDYDKEFSSQEPDIDAYKNVARNLKMFGGCFEEDSMVGEKTVNVISASSDNAQARYVYKWLCENNRNGEKSAVVLCDESLLQPVVFSIPSFLSGNVNITKGFSMKHTRAYSSLALWLKKRDVEKIQSRDLLLQLKEYVDKSLAEATVKLKNNNGPSMSGDDGGSESDGGDICREAKWYELLDVEAFYQARCVVVRFIDLIDDEATAGLLSPHVVRNILLSRLASTDIPFHGEPLTDVQVMGMLETRILDFDNLLLLNVEEGVMPAVGRDNSFIPYYLRKYYGLTTADEQAEVYAYNFFRLLRRANNITVMFSEAQTAERQKSMSRFVMQMLTSKTIAPIINRKQLVLSVADNYSSTKLGSEESVVTLFGSRFNTYGEKLASQPQITAKLSPSAINTFLRCRRLFFYRYMLELAEPEEETNVLQNNELGSLIHESVRAAFRMMLDGRETGRVSGSAIKDFVENDYFVDKAVAMAYEALNKDFVLHSVTARVLTKENCVLTVNEKKTFAPAKQFDTQKHPIETMVAKRHLVNILQNDMLHREVFVMGCELKKYFHIPGFPYCDLKVGGSIDRLDRVAGPDGKTVMRIIDYKTGAFSKDKVNVNTLGSLFEQDSKQGYVLQTFIYSLACMEDDNEPVYNKDWLVKPWLLFSRKKRSLSDTDICIAKKPLVDFREYKDEFKAKLVELVNEIANEKDFEMTAKRGLWNGPCANCKYALLCEKI
ncbi:MAG: PD-(D/E)XK nuclease family protein [Bacteroidaceae bacterium]|nr:PD-(D/E)XK nuclease family protein [Bacteroidaceae bacterium]